MTAAYIFQSDGLARLAKYVYPDTLFAFDLDGTIAPIVENFLVAKVSDPMRKAMERLNKLAMVTIITGRSRTNAQSILGFEPRLIIGNHGAEWPPQNSIRNWPQVKLCLKWQEHLYEKLGHMQGIEFEFKGESLSLHYRRTSDPDQALASIRSAIEMLDPAPNVVGGKLVINLLPKDALNKGDALVRALHGYGLTRAIYFGDDVTDEDVFRLKDVDLLGIQIGEGHQTEASYYLKNQSELLGLLNSMIGILESYAEAAGNRPDLDALFSDC
jgi:trehalose 6-phosphate phosphatase